MYFPKLFITFFVSFVSVLSKASAEKYVPENVFQKAFVQSTESVIQKRESFDVPITSSLTHRSKRTVNDYEIPVTVLYDDVTQKPTPKPEKTRRRQGINKKKNTEQSTENTPIKDITTTVKQTLTIEKSTARPHGITFPKRPEAENKRIEFQRRSSTRTPVVKILNEQNFVYSHSGNFHYSYDSEDGTKISSEGKLLRNDKNEGTGESIVGSVSYKDDEGKDYNLSYTADENGYRPVGAHLPTPPPIPPAIARALEHLATKKPDLATDY